jgi:hypothetical protein
MLHRHVTSTITDTVRIPQVSFIISYLSTRALAVTSRDLIAKQKKFGGKRPLILLAKYCFHTRQGYLRRCKILRQGTNGLTFLPKVVVLRIFIAHGHVWTRVSWVRWQLDTCYYGISEFYWSPVWLKNRSSEDIGSLGPVNDKLMMTIRLILYIGGWWRRSGQDHAPAPLAPWK